MSIVMCIGLEKSLLCSTLLFKSFIVIHIALIHCSLNNVKSTLNLFCVCFFCMSKIAFIIVLNLYSLPTFPKSLPKFGG